MSKGDIARTAYESARSELVSRLQLRDNVLLVYVGSVGALLGVALGTSVNPEILITIPYIAIGVAVLLAQHHSAIGALLHFCTGELSDFLEKLEPSENAPQWDNSVIANRYAAASMLKRTLGHFIILLLPCCAALLVNVGHAATLRTIDGILWWGGGIATVLTFLSILNSHRFRSKINEELKWTQQP